MVNTFLPYPDVEKSLRSLDGKRLFKQAVEAMQIIMILKTSASASPTSTPSRKGFSHHPAVGMWKDNLKALMYYYTLNLKIIKETLIRKDGKPYATTKMTDRLINEFGGPVESIEQSDLPWWFGKEEFHSSVRAQLYRKNTDHYSTFYEDSVKYDDYIWPVRWDTKNGCWVTTSLD